MLKITTSHKKSAWKAIYGYHNDRQLFHLGIDPNTSHIGYGSPYLFGGLNGKVFHVKFPCLKYKANAGKMYNHFYQMQNKFLYSLDTRY